MDERDTIPIPQPPGYPIIGNVSDIDPEVPIQSLGHLARQYGMRPIQDTWRGVLIVGRRDLLTHHIREEADLYLYPGAVERVVR